MSSELLKLMNVGPATYKDLKLLGIDTVQALAQASPDATPSSPAGNPIGWDKFAKWSEKVNMPIYALGGLTPQDLEIAKSHRAYGVRAKSSLRNLKENVSRWL